MSAAAGEVLLETRGLTRRFGALCAVDSVSLRFRRGEAHAIIGPNGAGKSTLLNLLSGELRATAGSVSFRGEDVTSAAPDRISRLGIGRSYQTANLFPELTCTECLWLAAQSRAPGSMRFFRAAGRDPQVRARAQSAQEACGLADRGGRLAGTLSYGEQRQLELGMILATEPSLLLLDEPLAGLGHDEALRVMALLRSVARERTLVLIEHDMDAVFSFADVVTVLVSGRVLETGTAEQIRGSASVRTAYLGDE